MANYFSTIASNLASKLFGRNMFNQAFFQYWGGGYTSYDVNNKVYIDKGYNTNPDVFAAITQMATKTASVPYEVKKIDDKKAYSKLRQLDNATKGLHTFIQKVQKSALETKAYSDEDMIEANEDCLLAMLV